MTLFPAVPVRINGHDGEPRYALVDTSAAVSRISNTLWHRLSVTAQNDARHRSDRPRLSLTVCDEDFRPWLNFPGVPFELDASGEPGPDDSEDLVLGFESCLANLRVSVDYPGRVLTISSSARWLIPTPLNSIGEISVPRRIEEGKELLKRGAYSSAVAMLVAGLEELLLSRRPGGALTVGVSSHRLLEWPAKTPKSQQAVQFLDSLRNRAVHGRERDAISRAEAQQAFRKAKLLIDEAARWVRSGDAE
jgi:hypothetical protein